MIDAPVPLPVPGGATLQVPRSVGSVLDFELLRIGGTAIRIESLLFFLAAVLAAWGFSNLLQRAVDRTFRGAPSRVRSGVESGKRLLHYLVMATGAAAGLHAIGINLAALFAAGALFAVAIGFAMQNIVQNFVSGVILLVERSIQPGDVLEVEGEVARVEEMRIRFTVVRTRDEEELIVPNSILAGSTVKNYTLRDHLYRVRVPVGVSYGSDMERVREVLGAVGRGFERRSREREPVVLLRAFGNSAVEWELSVWIDDPWTSLVDRSELHQSIWWALRDAGITIAYPQLDLHLDRTDLEALASTRRGTE